MFFNNVSPACQRHSRIEESSSLNSFALNSKNPDLLETKGTAAQDRVQPALAVVVASSLIVSSFPSINSIFSHAWHFLFLKGNSWSQVSSPGCQLLTFGVRSFQRPNARYPTCRKKKQKTLCVILSCREPKKEKRTCDATTDPLCPHEQRQHWSARAIGHLSEATVAATVQKVKGKVNDVGRHKPVFPCFGWMLFVFFVFFVSLMFMLLLCLSCVVPSASMTFRYRLTTTATTKTVLDWRKICKANLVKHTRLSFYC